MQSKSNLPDFIRVDNDDWRNETAPLIVVILITSGDCWNVTELGIAAILF